MFKEALQEKLVGFVIVLGGIVCVLSLVAGWMFMSAGVMHGTMTRNPYTNAITDPGDANLVPMMILTFLVGVAMIVSGFVFGFWKTKTQFVGDMSPLPDVRVIVRQGFKKDWSLALAEWELEETPDAHYTVRLQKATGEILEYECRPETYFACGEGMFGEALVQGKWLGRFTPYIGVRPTETPMATGSPYA